MTAVCSALHPLRVTHLIFCIIAEMPSDEISCAVKPRRRVSRRLKLAANSDRDAL